MFSNVNTITSPDDLMPESIQDVYEFLLGTIKDWSNYQIIWHLLKHEYSHCQQLLNKLILISLI